MAALPSLGLVSASPVPSPCCSLRFESSASCSFHSLPPTFPLDSPLSAPTRCPPPFKIFKHRRFATASEDEWGDDPSGPDTAEESLKKTVNSAAEEFSGVAELKTGLIDNLFGTDRGLKVSSETRAEIVELITQLEAKNPTPAPTEALPLLNGKWILAYTSFSELFPLLAAGTLPLVTVGEISQFIDSNALTVENSVSFTGPLATTSFSASASFEVRSPKRVQIKFEEGVIGTPQLTDSIEMPENVDILGQKIDLTAFRGLLRSLQDAASSVARTISDQPPVKFPIRNDKAQSWLLTTYLDEDLRISRGDGGSIFVLIKEGSPLLSQ